MKCACWCNCGAEARANGGYCIDCLQVNGEAHLTRERVEQWQITWIDEYSATINGHGVNLSPKLELCNCDCNDFLWRNKQGAKYHPCKHIIRAMIDFNKRLKRDAPQ